MNQTYSAKTRRPLNRKSTSAALPAGYVSEYDQDMRLWIVIRKDRDGNQIGACGYGATKADALADHHRRAF